MIFMDPPREGSTPEFLASVARMAPKRVVYVSCNPVTLARDLATLTKLAIRPRLYPGGYVPAYGAYRNGMRIVQTGYPPQKAVREALKHF